jgi:hypothetical protein
VPHSIHCCFLWAFSWDGSLSPPFIPCAKAKEYLPALTKYFFQIL